MTKKLYLILAIAIFMQELFAEDPVFGLWKSVDKKTHKGTGIWKIYERDDKLFGEMVMTAGWHPQATAVSCNDQYNGFPKKGKVNKMPLTGTPFIYHLIKKNEGTWHKGYIIDPASGKYYNCKITFRKADGRKFKKNVLEMRGEIGLGIGRSQYWIKTDQEETEALIKNNNVEHGHELAAE